MSHPLSFQVARMALTLKQLIPQDAEALQILYEQCNDYALLEQGSPYQPTAARDEFDALPPGKTLDDKFLFGLFDEAENIVALIEAIRHYPDEKTWWLGLMLIAPNYRRRGLGTHFYQNFENWVAQQGARSIQLAVLEENEWAHRFWSTLGFREIRRTEPKTYGQKVHKLIVMGRPVA